MGFTAQMKAELARVLPSKPCCREAELAGFVQSAGEARRSQTVAETRIPAVARKLFLLCKHYFSGLVQLETVQRRPRRSFLLQVPPEAAHRVEALRKWRLSSRGKACCRASFLRGATLATGYLVDPQKGHHLEWVVGSERGAANLRKALVAGGVQPGSGRRKGASLVYLKGAEAIVEVLALMGAHETLLRFEDVRVLKGVRNRVNRLVNAETANVDKTVTAALRQVDAIRLLQAHRGLARLPDGLRAVAEARLAYPYASLRELGERMEPPLSKSAIGHRMRRLMELAGQLASASEGEREELGEEEGS